jgi:putative copper resistance protein D
MPFHAFLGVAIMGASTLIAEDFYREVGRTWGPSLAKDQEIAGGLLWASGDIVALVVLGALFVQWARASEREAAREDRRLDRLEAARRA